VGKAQQHADTTKNTTFDSKGATKRGRLLLRGRVLNSSRLSGGGERTQKKIPDPLLENGHLSKEKKVGGGGGNLSKVMPLQHVGK